MLNNVLKSVLHHLSISSHRIQQSSVANTKTSKQTFTCHKPLENREGLQPKIKNMNASEVLSAVGWGLEWENREGLQPKIKNRRLALLHLHFQVDSEEHKNSNFGSGFPSQYKGIYAKIGK